MTKININLVLKSKCTSKIILQLMMLFFVNNLCGAQHVKDQEKVIFSLQKKPISEAIHIVEKETGYKVSLKNINLDLLVSGNLENGDISKFFMSLLKDFNTSVLINNADKKIIVVSLGPKNLNKKKIISDKNNIQNLTNYNYYQHDFGEEFSIESANVMLELQAESIEKELNDQDGLDPLTGLTFGEVKKIHREQATSIEKEWQR